eukprot:scaffold20124_cov20-Tisochrysis_lutea.AAC.1
MVEDAWQVGASRPRGCIKRHSASNATVHQTPQCIKCHSAPNATVHHTPQCIKRHCASNATRGLRKFLESKSYRMLSPQIG